MEKFKPQINPEKAKESEAEENIQKMADMLMSMDLVAVNIKKIKQENEGILEKIKSVINFDDLKKKVRSKIFKKEVIIDLLLLAYKLKDKLSAYKTFLSDDASGRLVTLFLRKIAKSKGLSPQTFFIASGRDTDLSKVKKFLKSKKEGMGKVLVITEYIGSGDSISNLSRLLTSIKIDHKIATLYMHGMGFVKSEVMNKITVGNLSLFSGVPPLYHAEKFSGVTKSNEYKEVIKRAHPERSKEAFNKELSNQNPLKIARQDINIIAKEFEKLF